MVFSEIDEAVAHLDLNEQAVESLIDFFKAKKIEVIVENDDNDEIDESEMDFGKLEDVIEDDDDIFLDEKMLQREAKVLKAIEKQSSIISSNVKVTDPVKMYLKEIGKVPLLSRKKKSN